MGPQGGQAMTSDAKYKYNYSVLTQTSGKGSMCNNKNTVERIRIRTNLLDFVKHLGLRIEGVQIMKHSEGKETNPWKTPGILCVVQEK